jgi:hypothetical protein
MKKVLIVLLFLLTFNARVRAEGSYNLHLNVGEVKSDLEQNLSLEYSGSLRGYSLDTRLQLSKDYRIYFGSWDDEKLDITDYLVDISNNEIRLSLGQIIAPSTSYFISNDSLIGTYISYNKYKIWGGNSFSEGTGFSGGDIGRQIGISYTEDNKLFGYQFNKKMAYYDLKEDELKYNNNHYITYNDYYYWQNTYLSIDSVYAADFEENIHGEGISLRLASNYKDINYNLSGFYKSAGLEAVNSKVNTGYGEYKVALGAYRSFRSYLLRGRISYDEDNLNRKYF